MQLWQFVLYAIYGCFMLICSQDYPTFWLYFGLTQPPFFFWLFFDFYLKAYNKHEYGLIHFVHKCIMKVTRKTIMKREVLVNKNVKLLNGIKQRNKAMSQVDLTNMLN